MCTGEKVRCTTCGPIRNIVFIQDKTEIGMLPSKGLTKGNTDHYDRCHLRAATAVVLPSKGRCHLRACTDSLPYLCEYLLELLKLSQSIWFSFHLCTSYSFEGSFDTCLIHFTFINLLQSTKI